MFERSTRIARVAGIPIRVHFTLWLLLPVIAINLSRSMGLSSLGWGLLAAFGVFTSVALHELGHSLVAVAFGCRVRDITLLPIGGVAQLERMPTRPRHELLVAVAGPLVSIALSLLFRTAARPLAHVGAVRLALVLQSLSIINLVLALFNLLPSFPMDGGRIFRAWLTPRLGRLRATRIATRIGQTMAILFGLLGIWSVDLFLIVIAIFIFRAASAEYRMVRIREIFANAPPLPFGRPPPGIATDEVFVSPPPYEHGPARSTPLRPVSRDPFEDLFGSR